MEIRCVRAGFYCNKDNLYRPSPEGHALLRRATHVLRLQAARLLAEPFGCGSGGDGTITAAAWLINSSSEPG